MAEVANDHGGAIISDQGALRIASTIADEKRKATALPEIPAILNQAKTPGASPESLVEALETAAANIEASLGFSATPLTQQLDAYIAAIDAPEMRLPPRPYSLWISLRVMRRMAIPIPPPSHARSSW